MKKHYSITMVSLLLSGTALADICLYERPDYKGQSICYNSGSNASWIGNNLNDKVSSIKVTGNSKVTVFEHGSFNGKSTVLMESNPYLGNFGDKISSIKTTNRGSDYSCIYADPNYRGSSMCVLPFQSIKDLNSISLNDTISSVRVSGRAYLNIHQHSNHKGKYTRIMDSVSDLGTMDGWTTSIWSGKRTDDNYACLYEGRNYKGTPICLSSNSEMIKVEDANLNDKISSIRVHGNIAVKIYKDSHFHDDKTVLMTSVPRLDLLEDDTSSIKTWDISAQGFACMYQDYNFKGTPFCVDAGNGSGSMSRMRNLGSSIKLFGKVKAEIFKDSNYSGHRITLTRDWRDLRAVRAGGESGWHDKVNTFKVSSHNQKCLAPWVGDQCDQLDIRPTQAETGVDIDDVSTWGGSPVKGEDGRYHLFMSRMTNQCGLESWQRNSECVRASSSEPMGPYDIEEVVDTAFCHNPTVIKTPDNKFVMYTIDDGNDHASELHDCDDGITNSKPDSTIQINTCFIRMRSADSVYGPWSSKKTISGLGWPGVCHTNPAPIVKPDGSVFMVYRAADIDPLEQIQGKRPEEKIYVVKADKWNKDYKKFSDASVPIFSQEAEDAHGWYDQRDGMFHLIFNNKFNDPSRYWMGGHAVSMDGAHWDYAGPIYNTDIEYQETGEDLVTKEHYRRERPQFLWLNPEKAVMFNGVGHDRTKVGQDKSFTSAVPIGGSVREINNAGPGQKVCPYNNATFDGANCRVFTRVSGVNYWYYHAGKAYYYSPSVTEISNRRCEHNNASFDGANCRIYSDVENVNYWDYSGARYYNPVIVY